MEENKLYLVYVERINNIPNSKGFYEYEFFFSEEPDIVWAEDWNEPCPAACDRELMRPDSSMYAKVEKLFTIIPFGTIEENSCFSCQDMVDQIVAVAWEDISEYENYPEPIRIVFNFGESYESVTDKLAQRSQFFSGTNKTEKNEDEEWMNN